MTALINQVSMQLDPFNDLLPDVLMLWDPDSISHWLAKILKHKNSQAEAVHTTLSAAAIMMVGDSQIGQSLIGDLLAGDHGSLLRLNCLFQLW